MLDEAVPNDIDRVISGVKTKIPEVYVVQMHKSHPADDDGLWWFRIPGIANYSIKFTDKSAINISLKEGDYRGPEAIIFDLKDNGFSVL